MSKKLEVLKTSLEKKQADFDAKIQAHFDDVRSANGQPLNDKRNGRATLNRWERQNDSLRTAKGEIEKTERAIEREEGIVREVAATVETLPQPILDRLANGTLVQWRKHPTTFFVAGVDKARLQWIAEKGFVVHKYVQQIPDKEQHRVFATTFNDLKRELLVLFPQPLK